jgi:hypothetical protein
MTDKTISYKNYAQETKQMPYDLICDFARAWELRFHVKEYVVDGCMVHDFRIWDMEDGTLKFVPTSDKTMVVPIDTPIYVCLKDYDAQIQELQEKKQQLADMLTDELSARPDNSESD